jgi:hypothetical protein
MLVESHRLRYILIPNKNLAPEVCSVSPSVCVRTLLSIEIRNIAR